MSMKKYKIGQLVTVVAYTPARYAAGVIDEMGTEELFKSLVGKSYRIRGLDRYGNLELRPTKEDTVWIGEKDVGPYAKKARP